MTLDLGLTIFMVLFQLGPKINGLVAVCNTILIKNQIISKTFELGKVGYPLPNGFDHP